MAGPRNADTSSCFSRYRIADVPNDYPWTLSFTEVPDKVREEMGKHLDPGGTILPWAQLAQGVGLGSSLNIANIDSKSRRTGRGPSQYVLDHYCLNPKNSIGHMVELLKALKLMSAANCLVDHYEGISGTRGQVGIHCHSLQGEQECHRHGPMHVHDSRRMDVDGDDHGHGRGYQSLPASSQPSGHGQRHVQFVGGTLQQSADRRMSPAAPPVPPAPQTTTTTTIQGLKQEPYFDQSQSQSQQGAYDSGNVDDWSTAAVGEAMDITSVDQANSMDTEDHKPDLLPFTEGLARGERGVASVNDVPLGHIPWGTIYDNTINSNPNPWDDPYHPTQLPRQTQRGTPYSEALDLSKNPPIPDPGRIKIKEEPRSYGYPEDGQQHVHAVKKEEPQQPPSCSRRTMPTTAPAQYYDHGYDSANSMPSGSLSSFLGLNSGNDSVGGLYSRQRAKGDSNTFPRVGGKDKTTSSGVKTSGSALGSLELTPFGKAPRDVRIFLTYSYDNRSHMKKVIDLYQSLRKNGFSVTLDETERSLVPANESQQMLKVRFSKCHYVLVCVSPKYYEDITQPPRAAADAKEDYKLNAQFIYSLMEEELTRGGNNRIIPVLFEQSGAEKRHLPPLLANMFKYRWPDQYKHLFYHLMEPEKVLQKLLTKRPGSVSVDNFPGRTTSSYLSPGPGTHYSGP